MGGLAVLFLLWVYLALTVLAVIKAKPLWAKGLVLLVALLIPTADAIYGRYKLKQMCAAEAGLKVYKVVHGVEGFMRDSADEYWIKKYDYQFSEGKSSPNYFRFSKQNGQIIREDNVTPKSKYRLRKIYDDSSVYRRSQLLIEDIATGEILATDIQFTFHGGWAERFLAQFSDSAGGNVAWCADNPDILIVIDRIVTSTLKH
jgi:hypothetical protein